jgi:2'-5' RNA ligase
MLLRAALVPSAEAVEELWTATRALRAVPGVTAVPLERLDIPITSFGNLLPADCKRLASVLRSSFEGADAPVVWFEGLGFDDSGPITLGLKGDIEPLVDLAHFVSEAAARLGLFVDRRRFRAAITVADISPSTSPTLIGAAIEPMAGWTGSPWPVPGLSLLRARWSHGVDLYEEFDLIAMA